MLDGSATSHNAALQIIQQAVIELEDWANAKDSLATRNPAALQLVFDRIHLIPEQPSQSKHYRPAWALDIHEGEKTPRIPYAVEDSPTDQDFATLQTQILGAVQHLDPERQNLSQLMVFLETYGSHLSWGEPDADIAIADQAKTDAAMAAALAQKPPNKKLALIGGDLMGVQKFIYTISSEGALKSLRARSFYLELATEEVVQQLLTVLDLPRTNVIYAGASKFYLLVAATDELEKTLRRIQKDFNDWLLDTFQRKVFLAIAHETFPAEDLKSTQPSEQPPLTRIWQTVNYQLKAQADRKFSQQLDTLLKPQVSHQPCKACHRDDVPEEKLRRLNKFEDDSPMVCETCESMFELGDRLPEVKALVRSPRPSKNGDRQHQDIQVHHHYYRAVNPTDNPAKDELVFQINDWDLKSYRSNQFVPMLLGNYFQISPETGGFLSANEMAEASAGIKRVGYLRMDVDRLSQIFSKGLGENYTLPRLASLSRQMTYFFKVYLNSLAESRAANFTNHQNADGTAKFRTINPLSDRKNLLFIYAGGDDLFVSGAWNESVEFAFDVYQAFRAYTGQHPDITLSAGVYIAGAKFPLYQAAEEAGDVEKAAKNNGRDSLGLFNAALKWDEWLGKWNPDGLKERDREYLVAVPKPALFGIFPFVERLSTEIGQGYTRSFVRNLLNTAQMQDEKIKEAQEKYPDQVKDFRYYLHLPKVAYALARLPNNILNDSEFRQSLKNPRNAPYFRAIATWIELLHRK